ncbi:glycoside hydrolase family 3 protein [Parafrankia sp. BMG5.11]|uniref:beta-glucosidase n=1 Tax=Parafrankia sp. BMG5.11 TaxID=222540 RepID=UPI00103BDECD|nr:glycoside hydrolase family 3 C-terminal domain-containing protein [Parafrankia sp. BMG5.11]TCJ37065.1 glycosyl hydrolase [Parafrankia sp. BMG5.11]
MKRVLPVLLAIGLAGCTSTTPERPQLRASGSDQSQVRAQETLRQLTFDEKIGLISGKMLSFVPAAKRPPGVTLGAGWVAGVERLGVPALVETDASLGVSNLLQMREGDVATQLPSGLALASTWNPDLIHRGGQMIGSEARAKGFNVMLVGGVNLVRDPRAGRNFEYLGEDPLLAGALVGAQISGVQSNDLIGTIKHFALNDQETGRNVHNVVMDEAPMRESDLLAFQIGIERGKPASVMCAYNRVNGRYACENDFLLNQVLRKDWGYDGFVMSDWGAVHSSEAILAGLDQQSGDQIDQKRWFSTEMTPKVQSNAIPISAVDQAVSRILTAIYRQGLDKWSTAERADIPYSANSQVALQAAEQGIVLLRNENNLLPLNNDVRTIAVVGRDIDKGVLTGGGSSQVVPVGGFKVYEVAGTGPAKLFARRGVGGTAPLQALREAMPGATVMFSDGADPAAAAAAAAKADVAIVFAEKWATETNDHADLSLEDGQDALIQAVAQANPRTVVVLQTGNPVLMPWLDQTPAVISAWFSGQRGGEAIAKVLTGAVNPSGHLPITFPASLDQLPHRVLPGSDAPRADAETRAVYGVQAGTKPFDFGYPEGSDAGYRWYDAKGFKPLFAFGHGLSYTRFSQSGLKVSGGQRLTIGFVMTNEGERSGADVAQVYVSRRGKAKRLVGWKRADLAPGQSAQAEIAVDPRVVADFDTTLRKWVVPAGTYTVELAHSATQVAATRTVKLDRMEIAP